MIFIKPVKVTLLVKNEDESTLSEIANHWQCNCNTIFAGYFKDHFKKYLPLRRHKLTIGKCIVVDSFFAQLCHIFCC
jgi:hypothetical protein